jgi:hypothetical protein
VVIFDRGRLLRGRDIRPLLETKTWGRGHARALRGYGARFGRAPPTGDIFVVDRSELALAFLASRRAVRVSSFWLFCLRLVRSQAERDKVTRRRFPLC